jgi:tripartite-type tricarboxylate transporter receptor subunit TctC
MKFFITALLLASMTTVVNSRELITIVSSYPPSHGGHAAIAKITEHANTAQNKYNFILDYHPGAQGLIALNYTKASPKNRIALVAAGVVELFETNKAQEKEFVPVYAFGDACWAVVTNWPADEQVGIKSLRAPADSKELVVGAVGLGSISHITGLEAAEAAKQKPLTILFKSGNEAFLNLASNNGVNLTIDSVRTVQNMKIKNPNLRIVGTTCSQRHPMASNVPTLVEQGLGHIPPVINIMLASLSMPVEQRNELNDLLDRSTLAVGADPIFDISSFSPAVFQKMTAQQYYDKRIGQIKQLRKKHYKELTEGSK